MSAAEPDYAEPLRPLPAQTNDGNPWVDGWCWLWCVGRYTRVIQRVLGEAGVEFRNRWGSKRRQVAR